MRRHAWRLSDKSREKLARYLAQYPVLKTLYEMKQSLVRYVLLKNVTQRRMQANLM